MINTRKRLNVFRIDFSIRRLLVPLLVDMSYNNVADGETMIERLPFSGSKRKQSKDDLEIDDDFYDRQSGQISLSDYLKLLAIVVLLGSSVFMFKYRLPPTVRRVVSNIDTKNMTAAKEVYENPYGFHPFYKVHQRIQYKSPSTNPCNGIDGSKTILLALLSRASNVHIREAIRQTWGGVRVYGDIEVRTTFVVGVDDGMVKQIEIEQNIYHGKNFSNELVNHTLLFS